MGLRRLAEQLEALEKQSRYPYIYGPSLQELSARVPELQYLHPLNAVTAASKGIRGALYRRKVEKARVKSKQSCGQSRRTTPR